MPTKLTTARHKPIQPPNVNGGTIYPPEYQEDAYMGLIIQAASKEPLKYRLMIGVPSTGLVRMEWAMARYGQIVPTNWSAIECVQWVPQVSPVGYNVMDARNLITHQALLYNFEWLFFIDSDVILPPDTFVKMNHYIREGTIPVIFGLYCTKSHPPEPLVYRGSGTSYFKDFKLGDKFWVDGIGMGATLINVKLLRVMAEDAPWYIAQGVHRIKKVWDTPQLSWTDPEFGEAVRNYQGTEDLAWCKRVIEGDYLTKAGFPKIAKRKWPFLCDSSIACRHISVDGIQYPQEWKWS